MPRQDDLKKLITEHYRHLQILKEQEAGYGRLNVPTHLVTQIQDREAAIEQLQAELVELEREEGPPAQAPLTATSVVSPPISPMETVDPKLASFRAQPRIFLCHASEDKPRVKELYHQLKAAGYRPWLDKFDLLPGQTWRREIEKIIRDPYNLVLVCLSNNSVTKRGVVQQEIKWALGILDQTPEGTIYLIPVRLEACQVPDQLSGLHWVDLFEPDGFEYLKRALDYEIGKRQGVLEPEQIMPTKIGIFGEPMLQPELILIPAGEFLMGSDPSVDRDADENEQPQHILYLPDYYIAKTPVTNVQYAAFVQATGHTQSHYWENGQPPADKEDYPVVDVSWYDAVAYCMWLTHTTGKPYRLPTEAEWEKAARGTDGRIYPWGNQWDAARCNNGRSSQGGTTLVGTYPRGASPFGLLDMAGNVLEWCATKWYKQYPYDVEEDEWSKKHLEGTYLRVVRGGSWLRTIANDARCAFRSKGGPINRSSYVGFRVVVSPIL